MLCINNTQQTLFINYIVKIKKQVIINYLLIVRFNYIRESIKLLLSPRIRFCEHQK